MSVILSSLVMASLLTCANAADSSTLAVASGAPASAAQNQTPVPTPVANPAPAPVPAPAENTLPPYHFPFNDGLFASAAGYVSVKNVCFTCQRTELIQVCGVCQKIQVRSAVQDGPAPLVVVLLGVGGLPEYDFNKLWASWYFQNGYHVLTFESTFTQNFNERTHLGVGGNVWVETGYVRDVIDAYLHQGNVAGKVTKIGIVGMSYGGVQALMLGTMAADKKLPFEIAAIQAYSPPIRIDQSARIIDAWYSDTYGKYTILELLALQKVKVDPTNPESPIPADMLKAAVALSFRYALPSLVAYSDEDYHLNKLPKGDEFNDKYVRLDYASKWSFTKFAYGMSYPYWQCKLGYPNLEPLIHAADLENLINHHRRRAKSSCLRTTP